MVLIWNGYGTARNTKLVEQSTSMVVFIYVPVQDWQSKVKYLSQESWLACFDHIDDTVIEADVLNAIQKNWYDVPFVEMTSDSESSQISYDEF